MVFYFKVTSPEQAMPAATVCLIALAVAACTVADPLKRLGQHSPPSKGATILAGKFPPPSVFYHHFVHASKPLLMKNVLEETKYPAFMKWTDDYLSKQYGREIVDIERGKKEDRSGDNIRLDLAKFLQIYNSSDMYVVHSISESMQGEIMVPHTLQCGGFQDNLQDTVMWFSSGETKSVLHYDDVDNINCLFDGEKKIVMIDKAYKDMIEEYGWVEDKGYSMVDVDKVDPEKYSGILRAPWYQVNMEKGDCVYIPYKWYHHVYSPAGRNLAVNLWFTHLWWFNQSNCSDAGNQSKPLSDFEQASSNEILRFHFLAPFSEQKEVTEKSFLQACTCKIKDQCLKLWDKINTNSDRRLTWAELYSFDIDEAVEDLPLCFYTDDQIKLMYEAMKENDMEGEGDDTVEIDDTIETDEKEGRNDGTSAGSDTSPEESIQEKAETSETDEDIRKGQVADVDREEPREEVDETEPAADKQEESIRDEDTADTTPDQGIYEDDKRQHIEHGSHDEF